MILLELLVLYLNGETGYMMMQVCKDLQVIISLENYLEWQFLLNHFKNMYKKIEKRFLLVHCKVFIYLTYKVELTTTI